MSLVIRSVTPSDSAAENDIIDRAFAARPYGHLPVTEERQAFQRDTAGRAAAGEVLVATDADGAVIGSASVLRAETAYSRIARSDEVELRLLAVDPGAQGKGAGSALVSAALELAVEWGADALVLDTGSLNLRAQELYERIGFERAPEREEGIDDFATSVVYTFALQGSESLRVRLMHPSEPDAVATLAEAAYAHDYDLSPGYRSSIVAIADRAREHQVWVAEDSASGTLVGTVATPRRGQAISELAQPGELDFRLLAVDPSARRRGVGELLTRHVLLLARLRGDCRVVMNSGPEMRGAHRLYERMGFTRLTEREPMIRLDDGTRFRLLTFGYALP